MNLGRVDPMYRVQRRVERVAVGVGRAKQQRPVDVEQQQQRRVAHRSNDIPGSSRAANAAISRAVASMSSRLASSTGECM